MVIKFIKIILLRWPFQCTQPFAISPLLSSSFSSSTSGEQLMIRSMIPMQWLMITVSTQPGRPPWGLQGDCRLLRLCRHSCCSCQCEGAHTGTSVSLKLPQSFLGGFQMSLERAPLLTKGSFALYYGGENIIDQLSSESPGDKDFLWWRI